MEGPLVAETTSDISPLICEGIVSCNMNPVSKLPNFDETEDKCSTGKPQCTVNEMDRSSKDAEITSSSVMAQLEQTEASDSQDHTNINRRAKEVNFNLPSIEINEYTEENAMTICEMDNVKGSEIIDCDRQVSQCADLISQGSNHDSSFNGKDVSDNSLPSGSNGCETNTSNHYGIHDVDVGLPFNDSSFSENMEITSLQKGKGNNIGFSDLVTSKHYESETKSKMEMAEKENTFSQCDGIKQPNINLKELSPKKTGNEGILLETESMHSKVIQGDTGQQVSKHLCLVGQKLPEESKGKETKTTSICEFNGQSQVSKETKVFPSYSIPPNLSLSQKQHMETQVSLEVMCRSAATSPMTPPEGFAAAFFPYLSGKFENSCKELSLVSKKDAELQVGEMVNYRSVATAPMSPIVLSAPEDCPATQVKEVTQEEQPEPVQEVRWDEKGMTWEVYGAAVEVEVLGIAIQKHLEKQIKDHGKLPPLLVSTANSTTPADNDPSPPLSPPPVTVPCSNVSVKEPSKAEEKQEGKKKRRQRNPLRVGFRNMRRPRCCFRTNTIE
ncbi:uncharacterized protein gprin1 [Paramormyrops kingsleyae]|uniref:uncharacterized protein gprin1 n=1 Tax=Paramormyrops kingsleyae TaxID=1676925 RepID=UPI003B970F40